MQANLEFGKAAFRMRRVSLSAAILAAAPLIATLAICAPDRALAACGASHPAGVHATGGGGGVHVATSRPATSGGSGGGGGTLGCANGASAAALHGLPSASSGRVVETGVHIGARPTSRTATTRTKGANASAHLHAVRSPHHA